MRTLYKLIMMTNCQQIFSRISEALSRSNIYRTPPTLYSYCIIYEQQHWRWHTEKQATCWHRSAYGDWIQRMLPPRMPALSYSHHLLNDYTKKFSETYSRALFFICTAFVSWLAGLIGLNWAICFCAARWSRGFKSYCCA